MKDYLSSAERLKFLAFIQVADMSKEFTEGNLLTTKEKGDLKRAMTYITKTVTSVLPRLNKDARKAFAKTMQNNKLYMASKSELEVFTKTRQSEIDKAYEVNADYIKLIELIMYYNCSDCKSCGKDCEFYKEFEKNCVPELGDNLGNCKYAYSLSRFKK